MPKTPKIVAVATETLRPRPQNARTHSKKQLRKIADSIRQSGFLNPVLVDRASVIVAGHARVEAAKLIGLGRVPTITVDHLSPEEIRAYVIADNKLAAEAGWDRELLALELSEIAELAPDLDLTITGFEIEEIELLGDIRPSSKAAAEPSISDPDRDKPAVTRLADIWEIGRHRLSAEAPWNINLILGC